MSDYISREAAIECVRAYRVDAKSKTYEMYNDGIDTAISALSFIPAADVREVVRGRWTENVPPRDKRPRCSVCGELNPWKSNYCPSCGSKMEEEK